MAHAMESPTQRCTIGPSLSATATHTEISSVVLSVRCSLLKGGFHDFHHSTHRCDNGRQQRGHNVTSTRSVVASYKSNLVIVRARVQIHGHLQNDTWCNEMCQFRNWEIALFQVKCYSQPSIFVVATNAAVIGWVLACFLTLAVPNKSWPSPRARVKLARSKPTSIFQKSSVRLRTVRSRFSQNA